MSIKNWVKSILKSKGVLLAQVPKTTHNITLSNDEVKAVEDILSSFAKNTTNTDFNSVQSLRGYLTNERMQLFHDLVKIAEEAGVDYKDKVVADIGSGMAYLFRVLSERQPKEMIGLDTYEEIIPLAQAIAPDASFTAGSIYNIPAKYDVVFCMEVLEHMVNPNKAIEALLGSVKLKGSLILSVPNGRLDFQDAGRPREDGQSYWGHVHFWSPESWQWFLDAYADRFQSVDTGTFGHKHLWAVIHL